MLLVKKVSQYVPKPKPKPPRTITHPCFERVSAQEAEEKLSTQPNGFYIIRPKTDNPDKLSITWKIYDNVYRHFGKFFEFIILQYHVLTYYR